MNNEQPTLKELFSIKEKELSGKRLRRMKSVERMKSLKERLSTDAKEIRWPMAFSEVIKKINDLLNIRILDILAAAWDKYRDLLKYADRNKYSPDETFFVQLAEHSIKSEHHPYIEILINDRPLTKIDFEIVASLALKGIVLKIQDGKIKEILAGSCTGKGIIKCEKFLLLEKETESFPLPGSISLGEGVPIRG